MLKVDKCSEWQHSQDYVHTILYVALFMYGLDQTCAMDDFNVSVNEVGYLNYR